ncbi:ribosomal protein S12 methylthiotransferase RimO [Clostridia bacterium]|nr:ribosomal protein S12 methylthiotransferase RimO [Clostridia bacterium]
MKVLLVSLGCDKNLVDSEVMLGLLHEQKYEMVDDEALAEVIIVNTCSFIQSAKEESIATILELSLYKKQGNCKLLLVCGCLAQRYAKEIREEIPEVDGIIGSLAYEQITDIISEMLEKQKPVVCLENRQDKQGSNSLKRILTTGRHYAFLKIAEGCDKSCAYCIIPTLRGKYTSRELESLLEEAKYLVSQGVSELILVAQESTMYGVDLYKKKSLPLLLQKLEEIPDLKWIRLLYCYPEEITDELIQVMKHSKKICPYLDMPIQHVNNAMLKKMNRATNKEALQAKIRKLRQEIPGLVLRTTLITGFPGETQKEHEEVLAFIQEEKFERLGVFTYSQEEGTKAAEMSGQISEERKEKRQEQLMQAQQKISRDFHTSLVGQTFEVLIEGKGPEEGVYLGRTYMDAPDVDGLVFIHTDKLLLSGEYHLVEICDSSEYDLIGKLVEEKAKG